MSRRVCPSETFRPRLCRGREKPRQSGQSRFPSAPRSLFSFRFSWIPSSWFPFLPPHPLWEQPPDQVPTGASRGNSFVCRSLPSAVTRCFAGESIFWTRSLDSGKHDPVLLNPLVERASGNPELLGRPTDVAPLLAKGAL